ncbi:GNAT family N-acetyltransferase [Agreia sp. Leaf283]|uniref:GNAT family N-acetyltransferase n=1 Tax=Agreia sp. Leaf283 TaxID=1736321 RepID=UPI0006FF8B79|nr:GNAT family N-acetyltransferase [Agreia sp. Leaf283]KQP57835.1 acetyltransferase [Agreia sp. Leaf283]
MPVIATSGAHYDRAVTFSTPLADDIILRLAKKGDAEAIADAYVRNRQHLAEWEPVRSDAFFTAAHQTTVVSTQLGQHATGGCLPLVLCQGRSVVGRINVSNIVRGPFLSGSVGYWVDGSFTGRGLASAALQAVVAHSRDELGLHRLEASVLPRNAASRRVLARAGFESIGVAPAYLKIAGEWQDHLLTQRILL